MHVNTKVCPGCEAKLKGSHPMLVAFADAFRAKNLDAHVSCSVRSREEQEADYAKGVSKAHWGDSPHDHTPALALDWFRLTQQAQASFDRVWYMTVLGPAIRSNGGLVWGGDFHSITDMPHVELLNWKDTVK